MTNAVRISASLDDKVSGPLDRIRDKMDTIGGKGTAASFLGNLAAGAVSAGIGLVAGAVSGVTDALGASISKASDFNESLSKVGVVFGPSSKAIQDFAKTADVSLGLSETAALGFAGTFGNLFTNLKLGQPVAADMSKNIISLGGDLASFNNIETTDALDKLRAGLAGESEPLRALGVFLTEAKVKAEAMALGLVKGNEPLTEAAKVQARYSLILKETTLAQGDFARTSDGMANQQRINAARMENAWTRVGQGLLPIANTIMPLVADAMVALVEGIGQVITNIKTFVAENKGLFDVLGAIAGIIGNVLVLAFERLADNVSFTFNAVSTVIGTVFDVIKGVASGIIGVVRDVVGVAAELPGPWQNSAKLMKSTLDDMQANVESWGEKTAAEAGSTAFDVIDKTTDGLEGGAAAVGDAAATMSAPIEEEVAAAGAKALKAVDRSIAGMVSRLSSSRSAFEEAASGVANATWDPQINIANLKLTQLALKDKDLLAALKSKDDAIRLAAQVDYANLQKDLATQRAAVQTDRAQGQAELDAALAARSQTIRNVAAIIGGDTKTVASDIDATLRKIPVAAYGYGAAALNQLAQGMKDRQVAVQTQARIAAQTLADYLQLRSPAKKGPLSRGGGPEGWGAKLSTLMGAGMDGALSAVSGASSRLADAATFSGAGSFSGGYSAAAPASFGGASGGNTLNVTFQTLTVPSAAQREELERVLTPIVVQGFQRRHLLHKGGTF